MNRRKFISETSVHSAGILGIAEPSVSNFSLEIFNSGFKNLCDKNHLQKVRLPNDLLSYTERIKDIDFISFSDCALRYGDNYILEVKVQELVFNKSKLLFVTSLNNHLLIEKESVLVLDDFINNFQSGIGSQICELNPVEFLLPYRIHVDESAIFSYANKYGNQIMLKAKRDCRYIFIS